MMMQSNIEAELKNLSDFLSRYSVYEEKIIADRISADIYSYTSLFERYYPVDNELNAILATTAPYYNIFSVLNVRHYETKLHTPFLCHLLHPNESHQQGRLFFDSFLSDCLGFEEVDRIGDIQVFQEYSCSYGRIDILINYKLNNINMALVIENKVYHHDEEDQLKRYYEYLVMERKIDEGNYHLVYLKPKKLRRQQLLCLKSCSINYSTRVV